MDADFCPPSEKLAFRICVEGEMDLPAIWSEPPEQVVRVLTQSQTYQEVAANLPDIALIRGVKY